MLQTNKAQFCVTKEFIVYDDSNKGVQPTTSWVNTQRRQFNIFHVQGTIYLCLLIFNISLVIYDRDWSLVHFQFNPYVFAQTGCM